MSAVEVRDVPDQDRFEAVRDGEVVGHIAYRRVPQGYSFLHTEVDPAAEGTGVGSALVRQALDAVRASGSQVLPYCPFVRGWLAKHPEHVDMVPQTARERFDLA